MQNRLNVRQKDYDGSQKTMCRERGKKYHFQKGGGGINIVFGPKYRPLRKRLIKKMKTKGLKPGMAGWIKDWLKDRTQRVCIQEKSQRAAQ
jgi:hypothetical protein